MCIYLCKCLYSVCVCVWGGIPAFIGACMRIDEQV